MIVGDDRKLLGLACLQFISKMRRRFGYGRLCDDTVTSY
jgi:hypothetical protein